MLHYVYMLLLVNNKTLITYIVNNINPKKRLAAHNRGKGSNSQRS